LLVYWVFYFAQSRQGAKTQRRKFFVW